MTMSLLKKKRKPTIKKGPITAGLWEKCPGCGEIIFKKTLQRSLKVCPRCRYHFTLTAVERINMLVDKGSFRPLDQGLYPLDPLQFVGPSPYREKLVQNRKKTGLPDAVVSGKAKIEGWGVVLVITDSRFLMGSMGSVMGEKIFRAFETAAAERLPVTIVSGSGGGARMYEGCLSLMQMAKTSAAIARFEREGLLYVSVLTNPTMAGVLASFAALGDVLVAEPGALIGFTGPRVIRETIKQELPEGFQTSEFLLEHGLLDMVVSRDALRRTLVDLIRVFSGPSPGR